MSKDPIHDNLAQQILYKSGVKAVDGKTEDMKTAEVREKGLRILAKQVGAAIFAVGAMIGVVKAEIPADAKKMPTVQEYRSNPDKFPDHKEINLEEGDTAWDIGLETEPDKDPRESSDQLTAQDKTNFEQGIGKEGFIIGDPLMVQKNPEEITKAE